MNYKEVMEKPDHPLKKYIKLHMQEVFNKRDEIEALTSEEVQLLGNLKFVNARRQIYHLFKENNVLESYPKIYQGFGFREFEMSLGEKS